MSVVRIFNQQVNNDIAIAPGVFDGLFQIEISGTLGAATLTTQIQSNFDQNVWITVADGVWPSPSGDAFTGQDAALIQVVSSVLRFVLSGVDNTTSISLSVSKSSA